MIKTINSKKWKYLIRTVTVLLCLMGCKPTQDQEKKQLEIVYDSLYQDERGYAQYAFFLKNNNDKMIKSAKLSLFLLGSKSGMIPKEVRLKNLAAGDSIYLSINLLTDYSIEQGYHLSSKVDEIVY